MRVWQKIAEKGKAEKYRYKGLPRWKMLLLFQDLKSLRYIPIHNQLPHLW
jgi:hypothetical protein